MKDFFKWIGNFFYKEAYIRAKIFLLAISWAPLLFITYPIIELKNGKLDTHKNVTDAMTISFFIWIAIIVIYEIYYFRKK